MYFVCPSLVTLLYFTGFPQGREIRKIREIGEEKMVKENSGHFFFFPKSGATFSDDNAINCDR